MESVRLKSKTKNKSKRKSKKYEESDVQKEESESEDVSSINMENIADELPINDVNSDKCDNLNLEKKEVLTISENDLLKNEKSDIQQNDLPTLSDLSVIKESNVTNDFCQDQVSETKALSDQTESSSIMNKTDNDESVMKSNDTAISNVNLNADIEQDADYHSLRHALKQESKSEIYSSNGNLCDGSKNLKELQINPSEAISASEMNPSAPCEENVAISAHEKNEEDFVENSSIYPEAPVEDFENILPYTETQLMFLYRNNLLESNEAFVEDFVDEGGNLLIILFAGENLR
ncbi:hypothetical protein GQR58_000951 [Nymphon striatum]|nr:hypothetical protein GQR58_000951 [Nymphon striatum]